MNSAAPIKLLFIGESGAGKTGALASLATAGYNLRVIDIDKGCDILANYLTDPNSEYYKKDPKAAERVEVVQVSDPMKNLSGRLVPTRAVGWPKVTKLLTAWEDGGVNLGPISSWGPKDILVIDSLTGLSNLALHYHLMVNSALGATRSQNEWRRDIGAAQGYIRDMLDLLYDDGVSCNIIVISHITVTSEAGGTPKVEEGEFKNVPSGYPSAIGRSLSPQIPRWFNNMLVANKVIQGTRSVQKIFTQSQYVGGMNVSAKTSAPLKIKPSYDIAWGLAEFFRDLKGE